MTEKKVALITGAASGIGEATARLFAERQHRVLVVDVNRDDGEQVASDLTAAGRSARFVSCDLRSEADIISAVDSAYEWADRLDVVANIAGAQVAKELHETSTEEWNLVNAVNVTAPFLLSKHAILRWMDRGCPGVIVNIASIAGIDAEPGAGAYSVSKHAVVGLTKVLASTYGPAGIRCNAISPGSTRTPLFESWLASMDDGGDLLARLEAIYPSRRLFQPREIASLVYLLASEEASAVNGVNLPADGGLTATMMENAVL
jgi:NAD(P)-dependent dehydrogenase (short-subunit alcohol dehydrogenase family)